MSAEIVKKVCARGPIFQRSRKVTLQAEVFYLVASISLAFFMAAAAMKKDKEIEAK